jgi:protein MpaA
MQRLLINIGGYKGEGILIEKVLRDVDEEANRHRWEAVPITLADGTKLPAFQKLAPNPRKNVYISAGIHGDEPAGPLAALELLKENIWPNDANIWLVACLNPNGFTLNRRENEAGIDLNRDYRSFQSEAIRAHKRWMDERPRFDVSLLLHEDWESNGFYLYELNPNLQPSLAEPIVAAVKEVCPIDTSPEIEGRKAKNGIICANPDLLKRPDWPEAFYLVHYKTPLSYTLEAPSDFPLRTRVQALVTGVKAGLNAL